MENFVTPANEPLYSWILLVCRLFLAAPFVVSTIHKGIWYQKAVDEYRQFGVPELFVIMTIALHLVASLALILGFYVAEASLALAVFTVIATATVHNFWARTGIERLIHGRIAVAQLALVGGPILLAAVDPGTLVL